MTGKQYFEKVAPQWEELRSSFFSEQVREKAISLAEPRSGRLALDMGAGSGFMTKGLLEKGLQVIAIDRSPAMLKELEKNLGANSLLECRLGDENNLPAVFVDYVFANMYLHHTENPEQAVAALAASLKPGGKLVITDLQEHNFDFLLKEHHDRWPGFNPQKVLDWFTAAGLKASRQAIQEDCCACSDCSSQKARIGIFAALGVK